jgi:hypothetical protein
MEGLYLDCLRDYIDAVFDGGLGNTYHIEIKIVGGFVGWTLVVIALIPALLLALIGKHGGCLVMYLLDNT